MAGHSKWANIKHRKGAQDRKRANIFTKLTREIIVAAKSGQPDPDFNPRLRTAIAAAKAQSLPKDKIEYAIKKGSGELDDGENFEEVRYEGYGPSGVALIIDCLTDNRNRTAAEVRTALGKAGGNLGESGSVAFMFERIGLIHYPADVADPDSMFEAALEAGADNVESGEDGHDITCQPDDLNNVQEALANKFGDPETAKLDWNATTTTPADKELAEKILNLVDTLEDCDDVQSVATNADISDDVLEALAG